MGPDHVLAMSYMVFAEYAGGARAISKAHIPLCGNTEKSLTVYVSAERPPTSVKVPLDPNNATKFHNHPVDPSIWKELNTKLTEYLHLSGWRDSLKSDYEYQRDDRARFGVFTHPTKEVEARKRENDARQRLEVATKACDMSLVNITGVIYNSIDSWVGNPASKDATKLTMTE